MNPMENAMPMSAIALPRFDGCVSSVAMAMLRLGTKSGDK